jgi:Cof subfamily protein (haloacid dehalogenase superfamily)
MNEIYVVNQEMTMPKINDGLLMSRGPATVPDAMKRLYVTDLDGTLIRNDLTLSPWSRHELIALLEEGVAITVATARSISSLSALLGDIPFRLPVVDFNGAYLTDYATRRHRFVHAVPRVIAQEVHKVMGEEGVRPFLSTYDGARDLLFYTEAVSDGEKAYLQERVSFANGRLRHVHDLAEPLQSQVICFTVIERQDRIARLRQRLTATFEERLIFTLAEYRYTPGWFFLTVHDVHATKDQGIRALQAACGMEDHELVVFGDDVNDIPMFRIAARGVAVANAVDAVKQVANEMTGSNEEEGVVRWIRSHESSSRSPGAPSGL